MLINLDPSVRQVRQFARVWLPLFGFVLGGLQWYRGASSAVWLTVWAVAALLTAGSLASSAFARGLFLALLYVTAPIGWVVGTTLMAVIYFVVLTPLALTRRALGTDLLRLRRPASGSYWEPRAQRPGVDHHFSQF